MPFEVEAVMTAKEFGVVPSALDEEEDALLHVGMEGEAALRALAVRDAALDSKFRVRPTSGQWRLIMRIDEIMKQDGMEKRRAFEESYSEDDLAGINVED